MFIFTNNLSVISRATHLPRYILSEGVNERLNASNSKQGDG
jgi:hypothetical protein